MTGRFSIRLKRLGSFHRSFLFLDTGRFPTALTLVKQLRSAHTTGFVDHNAFNVGRKEGEQTLYADTVGDFANRERGCCALAL